MRAFGLLGAVALQNNIAAAAENWEYKTPGQCQTTMLNSEKYNSLEAAQAACIQNKLCTAVYGTAYGEFLERGCDINDQNRGDCRPYDLEYSCSYTQDKGTTWVKPQRYVAQTAAPTPLTPTRWPTQPHTPTIARPEHTNTQGDNGPQGVHTLNPSVDGEWEYVYPGMCQSTMINENKYTSLEEAKTACFANPDCTAVYGTAYGEYLERGCSQFEQGRGWCKPGDLTFFCNMQQDKGTTWRKPDNGQHHNSYQAPPNGICAATMSDGVCVETPKCNGKCTETVCTGGQYLLNSDQEGPWLETAHTETATFRCNRMRKTTGNAWSDCEQYANPPPDRDATTYAGMEKWWGRRGVRADGKTLEQDGKFYICFAECDRCDAQASDCQGYWSECDSSCNKHWTTTARPVGNGAACPTETKQTCNYYEGQCLPPCPNDHNIGESCKEKRAAVDCSFGAYLVSDGHRDFQGSYVCSREWYSTDEFGRDDCIEGDTPPANHVHGWGKAVDGAANFIACYWGCQQCEPRSYDCEYEYGECDEFCNKQPLIITPARRNGKACPTEPARCRGGEGKCPKKICPAENDRGQCKSQPCCNGKGQTTVCENGAFMKGGHRQFQPKYVCKSHWESSWAVNSKCEDGDHPPADNTREGKWWGAMHSDGRFYSCLWDCEECEKINEDCQGSWTQCGYDCTKEYHIREEPTGLGKPCPAAGKHACQLGEDLCGLVPTLGENDPRYQDGVQKLNPYGEPNSELEPRADTPTRRPTGRPTKRAIADEDRNLDCIGGYTDCDENCQAHFSIFMAPQNSGAPCPPAIRQCQFGEGQCLRPGDSRPATSPRNVDCGGEWSHCGVDCWKQFTVTRNPSGSGAACPAPMLQACKLGMGQCGAKSTIDPEEKPASWSQVTGAGSDAGTATGDISTLEDPLASFVGSAYFVVFILLFVAGMLGMFFLGRKCIKKDQYAPVKNLENVSMLTPESSTNSRGYGDVHIEPADF